MGQRPERTKERLDELMEAVDAQAGFLGQDVALRQRLDHSQDGGVAGQLEQRGVHGWFARQVDQCAGGDADQVRAQPVHIAPVAGHDGQQLPGFGHRRRTKYGHGDEGAAVVANELLDFRSRVGMDGRAVNEELPLRSVLDELFDHF
jgi:hypothetical protein